MGQEKKRDFETIWAPALVSYTDWVIREALSLKIHKLYFLARDGWLVYKIACRMTEQENLPLECRYLEGSRYAWRMAEFYLPDADPVEKICVGGVHVTLRKILRRGGLDQAEAEEVARQLGKQGELDRVLGYGTRQWEMDRALSYPDIQRLKPVLSECGLFMQLLHRHAEAAYQSAIHYLKQEGVLEQDAFAIVDSGWIGSLQQTLEHLRQSATGNVGSPIHGFYFGLYELPENVDPAMYHTYYFRPYKDIEKKVRFNNCLFEAVCSAKEGMTVGYREEDSRMLPVCETAQNPNRERMIRNELCLERLLAQPDKLKSLIQPRKEVQRRLEGLMSRPMESDVAEYGDYLFSDDVSESSLQPVAAILDNREIYNLHAVRRLLIMKGIKKETLKDSAWPEGSVARAGRAVGYYLFQIRMYKRLVYIRKKLKRDFKKDY